MKVTIIGAGAVGSVLGALLSKENEVTLVGRKEHVNVIRKKGLEVEGRGKFRLNAVTDTSSLPIQDVVIVATKAYDLEKAVEDSKRLVGPGTLYLVVQNGLSVLGAPMRVSFAKVCIGVAYMGATYVGPGKVRLISITRIEVGCVDGRMAQATRVSQLLNTAGIRADVTDDIIASVWKKTLVNAAVNPLTAISMETNGSILKDPKLLAISKELFEEGVSVAKHWNVLDESEIGFKDVENVIRATADNRSSMLQDLERGKRTEIDAINGEICRMSPSPKTVGTNAKVVRIVKALETWSAGNAR